MHWVYVSCRRAEAAAAEETGGDVESPSQHRRHSHVHLLSSRSVTSSTRPDDVTSCVREATEAPRAVTG